MNIYNEIRHLIIEVIKNNIEGINQSTLDLITCEQPKNLKFGDLSSNALMILGKKNKIDVKSIEDVVISELNSKKLFEKVTYIKPGFINFTLKKSIWYDIIFILKIELICTIILFYLF